MATLAALAAAVPLSEAGEIRGVWKTRSPLPAPRQEVASALLDGRIYILGGLGSGGGRRVEVYDIASDAWSRGPDLPRGHHHGSAAALGGRIYSIGGFALAGIVFSTPMDEVWSLEPGSGQWLERARLPRPRGSLVSLALGGRIYAIGGRDAFDSFSDVDIYDPVSDEWTSGPPLPAAVDHLAAAVWEGKIYAVGGRLTRNAAFLSNSAALHVFDPDEGSWTRLSPMPTPRSGHAAAAIGGFMLVMGGEIPGVFGENEAYDPAADRWLELPSLPTPRHGLGVQAWAGSVFAAAGGTVAGLETSSANEEFRVLDRITALAQFAAGEGLASRVLISNPGQSVGSALLELRGDDGSLLAAPPPFELPPGGLHSFEDGPQGALLTGGAIVFSDGPLSANLVLDSPQGFAGVAGQRPTRAFNVPILRNRSQGIDSGIALIDLSGRPNSVVLELLAADGSITAQTRVQLAALGRTARLLSEIFPDSDVDAFQGTLSGRSLGEISAMAILLQEGKLATLSVSTASEE